MVARLIILLAGISGMAVVAVAASKYLINSPIDLEIRGRLYLMLNQTDQAIEMYSKLTRMAPDNQQAFVQVGDLYVSKRAYALAFPFYAKAAELNPSVTNLEKAAVAAQKSRMKNEAYEYYRRVLQIDPGNKAAATNLTLVQPPAPTPQAAETPPAVSDQEAGRKPSQGEAPTVARGDAERAAEPPLSRGAVPCAQLLREVKGIMARRQTDGLGLLTRIVGPPYRRCTPAERHTYCFRCTVRGELTDSIEVTEQNGLIIGYSFGGCACQGEKSIGRQ